MCGLWRCGALLEIQLTNHKHTQFDVQTTIHLSIRPHPHNIPPPQSHQESCLIKSTSLSLDLRLQIRDQRPLILLLRRHLLRLLLWETRKTVSNHPRKRSRPHHQTPSTPRMPSPFPNIRKRCLELTSPMISLPRHSSTTQSLWRLSWHQRRGTLSRKSFRNFRGLVCPRKT